MFLNANLKKVSARSFTNFMAACLLMLSPAMSQSAEAVRFSNLTLPPSVTTTGVAYFTATSDLGDEITGATSPSCDVIELHTSKMDGDIMRMRRVDTVPLPAGQPVAFAPGSLHLMLIGLKKPIRADDNVTITFYFAHAVAQTVTFTAQAPRS